MSNKVSSASETEFRAEIGKAIPKMNTAAIAAGAVAGYLVGKKRGKRNR